MGGAATTGERIWRAVALALFVVLAWQAGNAALTAPLAVNVLDAEPAPVVEMAVAPLDFAADAAKSEPPTSAHPDVRPLDPTPEPTPPPAALRIGNTGGIGAYLRATPRLADRLRAWPDGTPMIPTGQETDAEGRHWREVRDPAGAVGWMPSAYLLP
jgi:hypothetical protein